MAAVKNNSHHKAYSYTFLIARLGLLDARMANFHTVLRAPSFCTVDKTPSCDNASNAEPSRNGSKLKHNTRPYLLLPSGARLQFRDLPYCVPTFHVLCCCRPIISLTLLTTKRSLSDNVPI
jgi:hypothetical protein